MGGSLGSLSPASLISSRPYRGRALLLGVLTPPVSKSLLLICSQLSFWVKLLGLETLR